MSNANDFVIENGVLKRFVGTGSHVVVPDGVKTISDYAFRRCQKIRSVQLPDSVIKIGDYAFWDCTAMERINIPAAVKSIGAEAFRNCRQLENIEFSGEPEKVDVLTFFGCWRLTAHRDKLPKSVQQFFDRMALGEISPDEAKKLYVFSKAKGVASVKEFQGVSWKHGPNGTYVYYFTNGEKNLIIPSKIGDLAVAKAPCKLIPEDATVYCSEEYFSKLSRAVKANIAAAWLSGDPMLQDGIEAPVRVFIKKYAEDVAYALKECNDPATYRRFLDAAKPKASLVEALVEQNRGKAAVLAVLLGAENSPKQGTESLTLDAKPKKTVTELKKVWSYNTYTVLATGEKYTELTGYKGHEEHVEIPESVGKFKVKVVKGEFPAEVESVEFPHEEIEIKCSFRNCKAMADSDGFIVMNVGSRRILTDYIGPRTAATLRIPDGVTETAAGALREVMMREVVFPEGFRVLAENTCCDCVKLQKVVLPESLITIEQLAFYGCKALNELYIPVGVSSVPVLKAAGNMTIFGKKGSGAEKYAQKYNHRFLEGRPQETEPVDFIITDGVLTQYVGSEVDVVIPEGVVRISGQAFGNNMDIQAVTMPDSVCNMDVFAFQSCSGLTRVRLSAGLKEIANYAFLACTQLQTVEIPEGVTVIGNSAFSSCVSLTCVLLPNGLKIIEDNAFSSCFALKDIFIPKTVDFIGERAFQNPLNQQKTVIHAPAGSYAETYAKENNIPFVTE